MSVFKDVLDKKNEKDNLLKFPEGIQFTDESRSKIIVSPINKDVLAIHKYERMLNGYQESVIYLKRSFLPVMGEIFLDFFSNGNINKTKKKLKDIDNEE